MTFHNFFFSVKNKCALNCLAKGEQFFYRHAAKVVDGTRCDADSLDVCVDGKCMVSNPIVEYRLIV